MAKDDFATDDFLLDQIDRTQHHRTHRRRNNRSQRRRIYLILTIAFLALIVVGTPSLISHSPLGRSLVCGIAARHGVALQTESVRVGWVTPLRLTGVEVISSTEGNHFRIAQVDSGITASDLVGGIGSDLGEIAIRGVDVLCTVAEGRSSIEEDFESLFQPSDSTDVRPTALIAVSDMTVTVTDAITRATWQVTQSSAEIDLQPETTTASFAGVLSEPGGNAGSLQGSLQFNGHSSAESEPSQQWQLDLDSETLPLSVATLVRRRFPDSASSIPLEVSGNTTGSVRLTGLVDGTVSAAVRGLQIRHLQAIDQGTGHRIWSNQMAEVDGDLTLMSDRIVGRNLQASTDFASAQLNGSFSRSVTLMGSNNNPMRWLDAIDGSASVQIDLAAFDDAMPGVLPLKQRTRIVSGLAVASIDSIPNGGRQQSRLTLRTDPFRASAAGQAVIIEPVELTAIVARTGDSISAEQFQWKSSFASVVGRGDLRSGAAELEIDFGRLASMLRPIMHISETELDGLARGKIHWDAKGDHLWRLTGSGNASHVQVTLPNGQRIHQPNLRGDINATGRWGRDRLDELTEATISLVSSGLNVRAELTRPVRDPSPESAIPIRVETEGRLESLADAVGPWLPSELHDADGGFSGNMRVNASTIGGRLTTAAIELDQPRIAYGTRSFSQPNVKIHFDGSLAWPSGALNAKSLTIAGDAMSASLRGHVDSDRTELEIAWRAKLERLQGSVRKRVASRSASVFQQVAFQAGGTAGGANATNEWLVLGDFDGTLLIDGNANRVEVETHTNGKNVAVVQPEKASAAARMVGPMPRSGSLSRAPNQDSQAQPRIVWSEPNLKVDGTLQYDSETSQVGTDAMQVATDWFATTLSGSVEMDSNLRSAKLSGPARLRMDEVAARLSQLTGTLILAEGVHQTPLDIELIRNDDGAIAFTVDGRLGWESGEVAGVRFGESVVPFRFTETSVSVSPSVIPVGNGQLQLAGDVFYRPGPIWMRLTPGVVAKSVRLTPEMTQRWLKYLAPLAADTTRIDGTISAEIDEAMIVIDEPRSSRASGRLNIEGVQMTAGPLTQQIIHGVEQLKSLSRAIPGSPDTENAGATDLVSMPPQSVEFSLDQGIVNHKIIYFDIDRARLITSGQVSLDGRLGIDAQVPLDARWLGKDLQGLAGQGVSLPITGTFSQPRLDSSGVRQVVAQLATQTIQTAGDTFLKKQLERGEDYIGEQIGRGLDKLFGR